MALSMTHAEEIKVVSFNLRRDFGPQRKNRWETRKELAAKVIEHAMKFSSCVCCGMRGL